MILFSYINNIKTERCRFLKLWGERIGYFSSYLLFTTGVGGVMLYLNKIPSEWSYFHLIGLTSMIVFGGLMIKQWLK